MHCLESRSQVECSDPPDILILKTGINEVSGLSYHTVYLVTDPVNKQYKVTVVMVMVMVMVRVTVIGRGSGGGTIFFFLLIPVLTVVLWL